ncbi:hypothetical protein QBC47DRAFT_367357 [Echria macrotheca]|uniref:Uncharacterized protein n=1 Tax=Echria macrotheca TaxID=438768 RepID=A0AAJ0BNZ9_9PEZI|nr:hypothetical protein QBC47DRAFT_367357 [Echria macrotheca]
MGDRGTGPCRGRVETFCLPGKSGLDRRLQVARLLRQNWNMHGNLEGQSGHGRVPICRQIAAVFLPIYHNHVSISTPTWKLKPSEFRRVIVIVSTAKQPADASHHRTSARSDPPCRGLTSGRFLCAFKDICLTRLSSTSFFLFRKPNFLIMPRPRPFRKNTNRNSTTQLSWSHEDIMNNAAPQSPSRSSLRGRNTGFPESFCGLRNTTLPHPDANLSPDAVLTEDDVSVGRALARHRASFMVDRKPSPAALRLGEPLVSDHDFCASPASMTGSSGSSNSNNDKQFATLGTLALASLRSADHLAKPPPESRSSHDGGDSVVMSSEEGGSSAGNSPTRPSRSNVKGRRSFLRRLAHR